MPAAQRLVRGLAAAAACTAALTGCLNVDPQTGKPYPYTAGVNADAGSIAVRNVLVSIGSDGTAQVVASLTNNGSEDDRLESVTVAGSDATLSGPADIRAGDSLLLGPDGDVTVTAPAGASEPGRSVEVELVFADAPRTTVTATAIEAASPSPAG